MTWTFGDMDDPDSRTRELVRGLAGSALKNIVNIRADDGFDRFIERVKEVGLTEEQLVWVYMSACDYRGTIKDAGGDIEFKVEQIIDAALPLDCARDAHSPCCRRP